MARLSRVHIVLVMSFFAYNNRLCMIWWYTIYEEDVGKNLIKHGICELTQTSQIWSYCFLPFDCTIPACPQISRLYLHNATWLYDFNVNIITIFYLNINAGRNLFEDTFGSNRLVIIYRHALNTTEKIKVGSSNYYQNSGITWFINFVVQCFLAFSNSTY